MNVISQFKLNFNVRPDEEDVADAIIDLVDEGYDEEDVCREAKRFWESQ